MPLRFFTIESPQALKDHAAAWDDLWWRSEIAMPTKRAGMLMHWLAHYAPGQRFVVLCVAEGDRMLAALPLFENRLHGLIRVGQLPVNDHVAAGDLLLDVDCDIASVLEKLVAGFGRLPWSLLWLDKMEATAPRWTALREQLLKQQYPCTYHKQFDIGFVDIGDNWATYQKRWSKNHRKKTARAQRRAEEQGELQLCCHCNLVPNEVEAKLFEGFDLEDRGWKGKAGTSILKVEGAYASYLQRAKQLAEWGQLQLAFLRLEGRAIAYEYGNLAKGVYFSHKIAYDEEFRSIMPGQMLMQKLLERFHADPTVHRFNTMGVLNTATAKWCTRIEPLGRLVIGTGGLISSSFMAGYTNVMPTWRQVRERTTGTTTIQKPIKLGAVAHEIE